ncbi:unnamed protein product [Anisakis simplex]|uniref:Uncharacterized protein n=1 Tax=Anisakis simplex TaxID=6269 RepID=A0A3P6NHP5_ANISI|nr:unnamed protein product [Anisakis simplex]
MEKSISQYRTTESDLRQQLSSALSDKKTVQTELDEAKRRLAQFEVDKKIFKEKFDEMTRLKLSLMKKIELLEAERRKAEAVISETAMQREAIERSLSALERENKVRLLEFLDLLLLLLLYLLLLFICYVYYILFMHIFIIIM